MNRIIIVALPLLLAAAPAFAAGCVGPDPAADRIQAMGKAEKTAADVIAACTGDIHKYGVTDGNKSMLAAAYEARAFAYEVSDMAPQAKADHDQAVALAPGFITWFNRGQFLIDASLFDAAADDLGKAIDEYDQAKNKPVNEKTYLALRFQRGEARRRGGHFAEAVADYTVVIAAQPNNDYAYTQRAYAYSHLGKFDEDIADLTQVMKLKGRDAFTLYDRGLAFRGKNDDADALADFTEAVTRAPTMATAHVARGTTLEHMGQQDKALEEYHMAAKLDPGLASASAALARLDKP